MRNFNLKVLFSSEFEFLDLPMSTGIADFFLVVTGRSSLMLSRETILLVGLGNLEVLVGADDWLMLIGVSGYAEKALWSALLGVEHWKFKPRIILPAKLIRASELISPPEQSPQPDQPQQLKYNITFTALINRFFVFFNWISNQVYIGLEIWRQTSLISFSLLSIVKWNQL